ncbi:MAG: 4'-phosphopantetheinyl transferase superfamily protein [Saprospiraceae bacterium]|nr:4'-phosphopantetheinyl transferase superfamily protein [Saprospiraceae bacterium]
MWAIPSEYTSLEPAQLHLWFLPLPEQVPLAHHFWQVLSPEEQSKAHAFRFEKNALEFIRTRSVLRYLLAFYSGQQAAEISFVQNEYGKPHLLHHPGLHFNVSHTDGAALLGFTLAGALGVDIENTERTLETDLVAKHFFAAEEVEKLLAIAPPKRQAAFYRCWTRKESIIKALGTGLSFPLKEFEVEFLANQPARLLQTHWDPTEADHWWMRDFQLEDPYMSAIALRGDAPICQTWKWDDSLLLP